MLVSAEGGKPVEFFLEAGATNDNAAFKDFDELEAPGFELKIVCFILAFAIQVL